MLVELGLVEQRYKAVLEVLDGAVSVTDVARRYGVGRQTVHTWLRRYAAEGLPGLVDRSSRPGSCPHQMPPTVEARVVEMRRQHHFSCTNCRRRFNERTGTAFNELQFPTDIVLLAVLWRLRYKLGLRDVAELLLQRGFDVSHEMVRAWEFRFAPLISADLRARRRGRAGRSWYIDETYVRVARRWCYLYRAIDRDGQLSLRGRDALVWDGAP